ncbi:cysteine-rich CWC family protein [Shewanella sp. AS1]|uniref:cysteine-rich CWC family protein n=1 Tax=Shewanella sp. AS1 TaxID=2907626 RepID=UPI001F1AD362|nr:cysteine-rich CWC family protein [Shewanella sp. AS1]MCE9679259.1 cysteine-rich CWC family protein [Shewanella sp. AS1]
MNPSTCPLCQQPNHCALSHNRDVQTCWCYQQVFVSKSSAVQQHAALKDVQHCICQRCAEGLRQEVSLRIRRLD